MQLFSYEDYAIQLERIRRALGDDPTMNAADTFIYNMWIETVHSPKGQTRGNTIIVARRLISAGLHHQIYKPVTRHEAGHYLTYVPTRVVWKKSAYTFVKHTKPPYWLLTKDIKRCVDRHLRVIDIKLMYADLTA